MAGTSPLAGLAVVNRTGYWSRRNVLQIVYLDSESESVLRDILAFVTGIFADDKYERLQVLFPQDKNMTSAVQEFQLSESEQFLLYSKVFTG